MMRLIAIEWIKLKNHRFFWIGMGLFLTLLAVLLFNFGKIGLPGNGPSEEDASAAGMAMMIIPTTFAEAGFYRLPQLWQNASFWAGFFKFIPAFLLLFFIGSEFEYRTFRQNIIDGLSIREFFLSKIFTLFLFAVLSTLVVGLTTIVLAYIHNDMAETSLWVESSFLAGFFMETFFLLSLALFLGILVRRNVVAIIVLVLYYFVLEPFMGYWFSAPGEILFDYLPTRPSRILVPEPFSRILDFFGKNDPPVMEWKFWWVAFLYSLIFLSSAFVILKRRDI